MLFTYVLLLTYHESVKNALIKDGWTITFDPYPIKYEEVKLVADLAGEKTISATRGGQQVVKLRVS